MDRRDQLLRAAQKHIEKGEYDNAERALASAWPQPDAMPADALYAIGQIRARQRRFAEARQWLEAALRVNPSAAHVHFTYGETLTQLGDAARAVDAFTRALNLDPAIPYGMLTYARALFHARRYGDAERAARALIATQPSADAYDVLSSALREQDRLIDAVEAGDFALALDPTHISAQFSRAIALRRTGHGEDALPVYVKLQSAGVRSPALSLEHAHALNDVGQAEQAARMLEQAAHQWPNDGGVQAALANARWVAGEGAAFTRDYEAAIARQPDNNALRLDCAALLGQAGFTDAAIDMLERGLARMRDPALLQALALLQASVGCADAALKFIDEALTRAPSALAPRAGRINVLLQLGRADEALPLIAPFRAADSLDQGWIATEALALRQLNDPRYHWLCDYEQMVQPYDLAPPSGFASAEAFNQALGEALLKHHKTRAYPLDQTLRGGTQGALDLRFIDDPIVRAYLVALGKPISDYIAAMRDPDHPWSGRKAKGFEIEGAWSVRLQPGGFHVNHIHPRGWISSAYYVALPEPAPGADPHAGWLKFGEPPQPMPGCGIEKLVEPKVGRLVLFPSYMWHGTVPVTAGARLTAPFDVAPL